MSETDASRARLVGINHVALEVGDVEAALDFYGSLFAFDLRGRGESSAFIDVGDQFLALAETGEAAPGEDGADDHRHVGFVVDDRDAVGERLADLDVEPLPASGLEFRDPWGNRVQVVEYGDVQYTLAEHVLRGMDLAALGKSESALAELREKGIGPE